MLPGWSHSKLSIGEGRCYLQLLRRSFCQRCYRRCDRNALGHCCGDGNGHSRCLSLIGRGDRRCSGGHCRDQAGSVDGGHRGIGRSIGCEASDVSGSAIRIGCSRLDLRGCSRGGAVRGRSQGDRGCSSGCDRYARRRTLSFIGSSDHRIANRDAGNDSRGVYSCCCGIGRRVCRLAGHIRCSPICEGCCYLQLCGRSFANCVVPDATVMFWATAAVTVMVTVAVCPW